MECLPSGMDSTQVTTCFSYQFHSSPCANVLERRRLVLAFLPKNGVYMELCVFLQPLSLFNTWCKLSSFLHMDGLSLTGRTIISLVTSFVPFSTWFFPTLNHQRRRKHKSSKRIKSLKKKSP
jgi:hypothetical protein